MSAPIVIGPRQHVTRVRHPQRGEGLAVRENGPSFFLPDGGEPVAMRVDFGGASSARKAPDGTITAPARSWMGLVDPQHGRVEADHVDRRESDPPVESHDRVWSPLLGAGWLVRGAGWASRFEPDDGKVVTFQVNRMAIGTPDYAARCDRSRSSKAIPMTDEEVQWTTYHTSAGTLGFRVAPPGEFPRVNRHAAPPKAASAKKVGTKKPQAALPGT